MRLHTLTVAVYRTKGIWHAHAKQGAVYGSDLFRGLMPQPQTYIECLTALRVGFAQSGLTVEHLLIESNGAPAEERILA